MSQTNTITLGYVSFLRAERSLNFCIPWLLFPLHDDADCSKEQVGLVESKESWRVTALKERARNTFIFKS